MYRGGGGGGAIGLGIIPKNTLFYCFPNILRARDPNCFNHSSTFFLYFIDEKEHDRDGKMLKMKAQFFPKNVEKFYLFWQRMGRFGAKINKSGHRVS